MADAHVLVVGFFAGLVFDQSDIDTFIGPVVTNLDGERARVVADAEFGVTHVAATVDVQGADAYIVIGVACGERVVDGRDGGVVDTGHVILLVWCFR